MSSSRSSWAAWTRSGRLTRHLRLDAPQPRPVRGRLRRRTTRMASTSPRATELADAMAAACPRGQQHPGRDRAVATRSIRPPWTRSSRPLLPRTVLRGGALGPVRVGMRELRRLGLPVIADLDLAPPGRGDHGHADDRVLRGRAWASGSWSRCCATTVAALGPYCLDVRLGVPRNSHAGPAAVRLERTAGRGSAFAGTWFTPFHGGGPGAGARTRGPTRRDGCGRLLSIDDGQKLAARALGLSPRRWRVITPGTA